MDESGLFNLSRQVRKCNASFCADAPIRQLECLKTAEQFVGRLVPFGQSVVICARLLAGESSQVCAGISFHDRRIHFCYPLGP